MSLRRLRLAAASAALVLAVGGCATSSNSNHHKAGGQLSGLDVADANNNGAYVQAGGITYQLQISRALNQYGVEDSQYIKGLPAGTTPVNASQEWYGVFIWAKNQHHRPYTTATNFVVEDTQGNRYYPVRLNPNVNPYAWTPQTLRYSQTEPGEDTTAAQAFTQGRLLLFKVPTTIYDNRPLTLYILGSNRARLASISLDL